MATAVSTERAGLHRMRLWRYYVSKEGLLLELQPVVRRGHGPRWCSDGLDTG